jgi:hypothetical protein
MGHQITFQSVKAPNRLRTFSINLSLVILALGFSALGFFSVIYKQPGLSPGILSVEHTYSLIGSIFRFPGRRHLPGGRHCLQRNQDGI